jgi:hypothetical protein
MAVSGLVRRVLLEAARPARHGTDRTSPRDNDACSREASRAALRPDHDVTAVIWTVIVVVIMTTAAVAAYVIARSVFEWKIDGLR